MAQLKTWRVQHPNPNISALAQKSNAVSEIERKETPLPTVLQAVTDQRVPLGQRQAWVQTLSNKYGNRAVQRLVATAKAKPTLTSIPVQRSCTCKQTAKPQTPCPTCQASEINRTVGEQTSTIQRAIDDKAKAIIQQAADTSKTEEVRAKEVVKAIVKTYFSSDLDLVDSVIYKEAERGLNTTSKGAKAKATGVIAVGKNFLENTIEVHFARRVAQVGHELEHIRQYRQGMTGNKNSDQREFLAFYKEALFNELEGTGKINHVTRINLIDGALGYYNCLKEDLQDKHSSKKQELVERRAEEYHKVKDKKKVDADPPTDCKRQD
jgi:hypothetical protein